MDCKIALLCLLAVQASADPPRDPCVCARNFAPVCGSDEHTYSNACVLNCENYKKGTNVTIASEGRCKEEHCVCPFIYKPICGNDGKTYANRCSMLCQRSKNPEVDVVYEGECTNKVDVDPPCVCTDHIDEVCGSDDNTYDNSCLLNCATAQNPMLSIAHKGKCDNKVKVADPSLGNDKVKVEDPSLGNDKVKVALPAVTNYEPVKVTEPDVEVQDSACVCPRLIKPVCGSDGITYINDCSMRCAGSDIVLAKSGRCHK